MSMEGGSLSIIDSGSAAVAGCVYSDGPCNLPDRRDGFCALLTGMGMVGRQVRVAEWQTR